MVSLWYKIGNLYAEIDWARSSAGAPFFELLPLVLGYCEGTG